MIELIALGIMLAQIVFFGWRARVLYRGLLKIERWGREE